MESNDIDNESADSKGKCSNCHAKPIRTCLTAGNSYSLDLFQIYFLPFSSDAMEDIKLAFVPPPQMDRRISDATKARIATLVIQYLVVLYGIISTGFRL